MVFTRQKSRADANPEFPPGTQPETNISELRTPSWIVFTQEQNELFVQQVLQFSQDLEDEVLHHHDIYLNESLTNDDLEKAYCKLAL